MNTQSIEESIKAYLKKLSLEEQQKILEFARSLNQSKLKGTRGKDLVKFASTIAKDDLIQMQKAIEENCEKVNKSEW